MMEIQGRGSIDFWQLSPRAYQICFADKLNICLMYGNRARVFASRDDLGRAATVNAFVRWFGSLLPVLLA